MTSTYTPFTGSDTTRRPRPRRRDQQGPPAQKPAFVSINLGAREYENLLPYQLDPAQMAHVYHTWGEWNRPAMLERFRPHLLRTWQAYQSEENESHETLQRMSFHLPEGALIVLMYNELFVYAASPEQAWETGESIRQEFYREQSEKPHFYLLRIDGSSVDSEYVELTRPETLPEEHRRLVYGDDILGWESVLMQGMSERHSGISLLQGPPGTGKTSFLRHLMAAHAADFRFYFIPSSNFDVLKNSEFVGYWAGQRSTHKDKTLVVILEDAEAVLATRASDNRAAISNLLNISDGLLGDFLRLHLICTMNADLHDLDPAILRPGRLVARRHFGLIPRERALRLLQYLEKSAPTREQEEYSLAELFNDLGPESDPAAETLRDKCIRGFAQ